MYDCTLCFKVFEKMIEVKHSSLMALLTRSTCFKKGDRVYVSSRDYGRVYKSNDQEVWVILDEEFGKLGWEGIVVKFISEFTVLLGSAND